MTAKTKRHDCGQKWLKERGWRRYLGGPLWYKPAQKWCGRPMMGQELFSQSRAMQVELRSSIIG